MHVSTVTDGQMKILATKMMILSDPRAGEVAQQLRALAGLADRRVQLPILTQGLKTIPPSSGVLRLSSNYCPVQANMW